jgi:mRNA-degrading endonuclease toxin of MazEF toxin-antitoxin module
MDSEAQEYYNLAGWITDKLNYHRISKFKSSRRRQVLCGQIWYCDLGYNVGTEKNKLRPVLVISNNKVNNSEKVVVICITDAKGKLNVHNLPVQDSWFLLHADTYRFLEKDSVLQCEEIRAVSKARLDSKRGCIGKLTSEDLALVKGKFRRTYNL